MLKWLVTWIVMLGLIGLTIQSAWGRVLIYWLLWMSVTLLVLSHADELKSAVDVNALKLNG